MLFAYLYGSKSNEADRTTTSDDEQHTHDTATETCQDGTTPDDEPEIQQDGHKDTPAQPIEESRDYPQSDKSEEDVKSQGSKQDNQKQVRVTLVDIDQVVTRLRSVVGSGKYAEQLLGKILLNLVDVGGQPGFLEMLPFLSKGPGMFLAFSPLDKDLDEPCEVSYERDGKKITPYQSTYTARETLYQILSAVSHHVSFDPDIKREFGGMLGSLGSVKPVATLVGTYLDKLETQVKAKVLKEHLSKEFPKATEDDMLAAVVHPPSAGNGQSSDKALPPDNPQQALDQQAAASVQEQSSDKALPPDNPQQVVDQQAAASVQEQSRDKALPPDDVRQAVDKQLSHSRQK